MTNQDCEILRIGNVQSFLRILNNINKGRNWEFVDEDNDVIKEWILKLDIIKKDKNNKLTISKSAEPLLNCKLESTEQYVYFLNRYLKVYKPLIFKNFLGNYSQTIHLLKENFLENTYDFLQQSGICTQGTINSLVLIKISEVYNQDIPYYSPDAEVESKKRLVGHTGEKIVFCYEKDRTKKLPNWISISCPTANHDIESVKNQKNPDEVINIEVKASSTSYDLYLSTLEFEFLKSNLENSFIYFLDIKNYINKRSKGINKLFKISATIIVKEMDKHIKSEDTALTSSGFVCNVRELLDTYEDEIYEKIFNNSNIDSLIEKI